MSRGAVVLLPPLHSPGLYLFKFWILPAARATIPPKCKHLSVPSPQSPHPRGGGRVRGPAVAGVAVISMLGKERYPSPMPLNLPHQLLEGLLCQLWSGVLTSSGLPTTDRCSHSPQPSQQVLREYHNIRSQDGRSLPLLPQGASPGLGGCGPQKRS